MVVFPALFSRTERISPRSAGISLTRQYPGQKSWPTISHGPADAARFGAGLTFAGPDSKCRKLRHPPTTTDYLPLTRASLPAAPSAIFFSAFRTRHTLLSRVRQITQVAASTGFTPRTNGNSIIA